MAGRREIETKQPKYRCDQSFGLAQRQAEDRPQRQRRRDRQGRIARLAAARAAGLGLPRRNRRFREPHGQAAALAQGGVIGGPIRHLVPLLRDVLTAILVRFEWHDDCPRVRNRAALLYRSLLARQRPIPATRCIGTATCRLLSHSAARAPRLQAEATTPRLKKYLGEVIARCEQLAGKVASASEKD